MGQRHRLRRSSPARTRGVDRRDGDGRPRPARCGTSSSSSMTQHHDTSAHHAAGAEAAART
jgi:hypothetical protein